MKNCFFKEGTGQGFQREFCEGVLPVPLLYLNMPEK
jgi:hypothetical protein